MNSFHPLLKGAIEMHCHSEPSLFPRKQTDWELIEDVKAAQMAGVVIKAHEAQTADRATLIRQKEPQLHVYGGLACNYFTGGLSPTSVDAAIRLGAKIIWMPTFSAQEHRSHFAKKKTRFFTSERPLTHPEKGLEIWDEEHKILPEVHEILELIAESNVILATGHLAPAEVMVLVDAAKEHGVEKILIQHTDLGIARVPYELEKELVKKGCILEKCYLACSGDFKDLTVEEVAESIKQLGAEHCIMVTDYGQKHNIPPIQALSQFIREKILGLKWEDIDFQEGKISIKRILSHDGKEFLSEAKTKSGLRSIYLPDITVDALKKHKKILLQEKLAAGPIYLDHHLVVCTTVGTPVNQRNLSRTWYQLLEKVDVPNIRFHDLRQTHATLLLLQGVNPKIVSERLGHEEIGITMNTYTHVLPSLQKEVAKDFGKKLFGDHVCDQNTLVN